MENAFDDYLGSLQKALAARAAWLEAVTLPALGDALRTLRSLFASAVGTLVKKGLLGEDRYAYDARPTELETPPDTPLPEGTEAEEAGARLAAYGRQIDLLASGSPFRLDGLKPPQLRKFISLVNYIDWPGFGEGTSSPTTRALAQAAAKVRLSPDALAARVVHESIGQICKLAGEIVVSLADVQTWQRESWKAEVRAKVLPAFAARGSQGSGDRTEEVQALRRVFDRMPTGSWNAELALQVLDEEHAEDAAARKERVLSSLSVPQPKAAVPLVPVDHRQELVTAIRDLCHIARELSAAEVVLVENEHSLETRTLGVFGRLRRFFQRVMGKFRDRYYEVTLGPRGPSRPESRTETIDFLRFIADLRELHVLLGEIGNPESGEGRRVQGMSEDELCSFLDWQVRQVRHSHRRMEGLNAFFQMRAVEDLGGTARSIKLELLRIENSIARAEKTHGECAARGPGAAVLP